MVMTVSETESMIVDTKASVSLELHRNRVSLNHIVEWTRITHCVVDNIYFIIIRNRN